jgi:hypothetical protein
MTLWAWRRFVRLRHRADHLEGAAAGAASHVIGRHRSIMPDPIRTR